MFGIITSTMTMMIEKLIIEEVGLTEFPPELNRAMARLSELGDPNLINV